MSRKTLARVAALAALFALMALPAQGAPTVTIDSVTVVAGTATVNGTVAFTPVGEQSVGGDDTNFDPPEVGDAAGIDLVDAAIAPITGGLRFTWVLNSLPPAIPPEGVRYTWSFRIGTTQYQLQAKRTNLASVTTTEDPQGHVLQATRGDYFQLRGACTTAYLGAPVAGCFHLAFLTGSFDIPNKRVSIDLPFDTRDSIGRLVAHDFVPGAVLDENQTAGMSITGAFQAVVSNTATSDYINGWNSYFVGERVQLGVAPSTSSAEFVNYTADATISGGTYSGVVSGLGGFANTVFARACSGTECAYARVTP